MMPLPPWLEARRADASAAAMSRQLQGNSDNWGRLIAIAQGVVSNYQEYDGDPEDLYSPETASALLASARVLDAASQEPVGFESELRRRLGLAAAVAFGMAGNFVTARAAIIRVIPDVLPARDSEAAVMAVAAPTLAPTLLSRMPGDSPERRLVEAIVLLMHHGTEDYARKSQETLVECILGCEIPGESALLRGGRLALRQLWNLSTARALISHQDQLPSELLDRLTTGGAAILLPPQRRAIVDSRLPWSNRNCLVALPTGTGKTLIGELCLAAALGRRSGLAVYVTPYVALGRQVADRLEQHLSPGCRVSRFMGGYQAPGHLDPETRQEVVVATPERFDALLRAQPEAASHLRCVVIDEAHTIESGERGARLEGLITRLRLQQLAGSECRLVLLSAVLSQTGAVADWLDVPNEAIIRDEWRPTARRFLRWSQEGYLSLHRGEDDPPDAERVLGRSVLKWANTEFYPPKNPGQRSQQEPLTYANVAMLADTQYALFEQPVLCLAATKQGTRKLARELAKRFDELSPTPEAVESCIAIIDRLYPHLRPLRDMLRRGVAFHNAAVPVAVREGIERAINARQLRVVAATTTLAEGIDLPFRVTIIADWLQFDGDAMNPMSSRMFRNISGRCGRPGFFTEGDTILYDNPVGELAWFDPARRIEAQRRIVYGTPEDMSSAASGAAQVQVAAVLGSQLLAAVPENQSESDLVGRFTDASFAAASGHRGPMREILQRARDSIISEEEGALARAASPLRLTEFGRAALTTGLAPGSVRAIRELMLSGEIPEELHYAAAFLMMHLADLPEQINRRLRAIVAASRQHQFIVKKADFAEVVRKWTSGAELLDIFRELPAAARSQRAVTITEWATGSPSDSWDEEFDRFCEFVGDCLESFLPWTFRAMASLAELEQQGSTEIPWLAWASYLERGVNNDWAVWAAERGAPGSRRSLCHIGAVLVADLGARDTDFATLTEAWAHEMTKERFPELPPDEVVAVYWWSVIRSNG